MMPTSSAPSGVLAFAALLFATAPAAMAAPTAAISADATGKLALKWTAGAAQFFRVESSTDLVHWAPAGADEYQGSGSLVFPNPAANNNTLTKYFWRAVAVDPGLSYPIQEAPITGVAINPLTPAGTFVAGGSATTFAITAGALPDGLALDSATGAISGTPTKAGSFVATVRATRGSLAASTVVRLRITPPPPCLVDVGFADYSGGLKGPFARNPWDMTWFAGRLYIGQGNSDNQDSPDLNAGPMRIVSLQPGVVGFRYEGYNTSATLPEEQIDVIKVIDGALYIPGHDPNLSQTIRTLYKRTAESEVWTQNQSTNADEGTSWGVHCYDIIGFGGKLITSGYVNAVSADGGLTWADAGRDFRGTALFAVAGKLYCATADALWINEYDPVTQRFFSRNDLSVQFWARFMPGIQGPSPFSEAKNYGAKIVRPVMIGSRALYLAGYESSDHQTRTTDVYLARSLAKGAYDVVRTTPANEAPWDLLVRGNTVYLLTSRKTTAAGANEKFIVTIWQSTADLTAWTDVWSSPELGTFARSFEEVDGDFFLGLGTDDGRTTAGPWDQTYTTGIKADSGRILWLRRH